ncbi:MAG: glycoside hydrolase family 11 protein [Bacteroidales bacterium]|nr:glycoside hydrolase family 11 protein [Bacteroidales bacterium]
MNTNNANYAGQGHNDYEQKNCIDYPCYSCGHIDTCAHLKQWESLGMRMGDLYKLMYMIKVGGGSGSLDCDYLYLSDGKF